MTKTTCFAYDTTSCSCKALERLYCKIGDCPFYKSREQARADALAAEETFQKHTGMSTREWLYEKRKATTHDKRRFFEMEKKRKENSRRTAEIMTSLIAKGAI